MKKFLGSFLLLAGSVVTGLLVWRKVEADRTDVVISAPQPELFDYQLSAQQGTLVVPPAYEASRKGSTSHATLTTASKGSPPRPVVRASTSYATLTLQTQLFSARF